MTHPKVKVTVTDDVGRIVIDNPDRLNAVTPAMFDALHEAAMTMRVQRPKVVVISGTGGNFCSGADVSGDGSDAMAGVDHGLHSMRRVGDAVVALHDLPMPTIAAVDGVAVGAGFGLALAADLLICTERARFSLIFARRALSLDFGTSHLLPMRIGLHRAKEMAFTAEVVNGVEAASIGFVNQVVSAEQLDATVESFVEKIAAGPPLALSMTKRLLDNAAASLAQAVESETLAQNINFTTSDVAEAGKAFIEKRPAKFSGS